MTALLWLLATWALVGLIAALLFVLVARRWRRDVVRRLERDSIFCRRQAD
jgi:hypothetical protein